MVDMAVHQILPAAMCYCRDLCSGIAAKKELGIPCRAESALASRLSETCDALYDGVEELNRALAAVPAGEEAACAYYHDAVIPNMVSLRKDADILESLTDKSYWPYPAYSDLLFY